jgi:2-amino-4-hydroxy-6-hydroxymethyldihydropteridine diphosphokinase
MSSTVFIGVGANIQPERNILKGLDLLSERVLLVAASTFYSSKALGEAAGPDFINGVVKIKTDLPARQLKFDLLRKIEDQLGRVRSSDKNAPRPLDFDILLYDDLVIDSQDLMIPDPQIERYPFVYIPLLELEPELVLPPRGRKLKDLVRMSNSCQNMSKMVELSKIIKERCVS